MVRASPKLPAADLPPSTGPPLSGPAVAPLQGHTFPPRWVSGLTLDRQTRVIPDGVEAARPARSSHEPRAARTPRRTGRPRRRLVDQAPPPIRRRPQGGRCGRRRGPGVPGGPGADPGGLRHPHHLRRLRHSALRAGLAVVAGRRRRGVGRGIPAGARPFVHPAGPGGRVGHHRGDLAGVDVLLGTAVLAAGDHWGGGHHDGAQEGPGGRLLGAEQVGSAAQAVDDWSSSFGQRVETWGAQAEQWVARQPWSGSDPADPTTGTGTDRHRHPGTSSPFDKPAFWDAEDQATEGQHDQGRAGRTDATGLGSVGGRAVRLGSARAVPGCPAARTRETGASSVGSRWDWSCWPVAWPPRESSPAGGS